MGSFFMKWGEWESVRTSGPPSPQASELDVAISKEIALAKADELWRRQARDGRPLPAFDVAQPARRAAEAAEKERIDRAIQKGELEVLPVDRSAASSVQKSVRDLPPVDMSVQLTSLATAACPAEDVAVGPIAPAAPLADRGAVIGVSGDSCPTTHQRTCAKEASGTGAGASRRSRRNGTTSAGGGERREGGRSRQLESPTQRRSCKGRPIIRRHATRAPRTVSPHHALHERRSREQRHPDSRSEAPKQRQQTAGSRPTKLRPKRRQQT